LLISAITRRRLVELKTPFTTLAVIVPVCLTLLTVVRALGGAESSPAVTDARKALFAARYADAVDLYSRVIGRDPAEGEAWYGLVRAQIGMHHPGEAHLAAEQALRKAPGSAGAETAAGLAEYRLGDLAKAEEYFRAALKIKPDYAGALMGLGSIDSAISLPKSARDLRLMAYRQTPDDPELMVLYADTLKGEARTQALEGALAQLDPASEAAHDLRIRIADDRAAGSRRLRRLSSPYSNTEVKVFRIMHGRRDRGLALNVQLNQKQTVRLELDMWSSGITLWPKVAAKAGLQALGSEASELKAFGDRKTQPTLTYLASEVRMGGLAFTDYPVSVFDAALDSGDSDGLIGPDVFHRFLVKVDFWHETLSLVADPQGDPEAADEPVDPTGAPQPGFYRFFRLGDHLAIPASINGSRARLFLLDSGSVLNVVDTEVAKEFTVLAQDSKLRLKGMRGVIKDTFWANLISLSFAGFKLEHPKVLAIDMAQMSDWLGVAVSGTLTIPMPRDTGVTIDYRAGRIKIDKP
jgi:tetratricopeptide (TPR) repeat protein